MTYRRIPVAVLAFAALLGPLLASCGDDKSSNPTDTTPPAPVTNLAASSPTNSSITLTWTAPGDDGNTGTAATYDLRYSTSSISEGNWSAATPATEEPSPKAAGGSETFTLTGLSANTTYYFALKTADEVPNVSALSNMPTGTTPQPPDTTPPAAVTNLAAGSPTVNSITLTWTAPGDDGASGTATEYDIRYSTATITEANWASATQATDEPTPKAAGGAETFTLTRLLCNTPFKFAVKTRDEVAGQWSTLSNLPDAMTSSCSVVNGMVLISSGTFTMGSPEDEPGRGYHEAQHTVTLTKSYYLMDHEVTQGEWKAVMGSNPSAFPGDDNRPVEQVSWFEAVNYCNARSSLEGLTPAYAVSGTTVAWNATASGYRLPTEAEWEYACRAGTQTAFASGGITNFYNCSPLDPNLDLMGWYCGNDGGPPNSVKGKSPNTLGLYDMHGNVLEWCWDWYSGDYAPPYTDPSGSSSGYDRALRGGGWFSGARDCRSASRDGSYPGYARNDVGFRVSRTAS